MSLNALQLITLQQFDRVGAATVKSLYDYSCKADLHIESSADDLLTLLCDCKKLGVIKRINPQNYSIDYIEQKLSYTQRMLERCNELSIRVMTQDDEFFPKALKRIVNSDGKDVAPLLLYAKGDVSILNQKSVALIGTRKPTLNGSKAGEIFSSMLAKEGFNIVSGLALGCDTAAHKGALSAGGLTTAIVATGLDMPMFPKENQNLAYEIIDNGGVLLSEYALQTPLTPYQLVDRDRLQSGMSLGTVVIQTTVNGGTMHAVNTALANHRLLYAVDYKGSEGNCEQVYGNRILLEEKKALPLQRQLIGECIESLNKEYEKYL